MSKGNGKLPKANAITPDEKEILSSIDLNNTTYGEIEYTLRDAAKNGHAVIVDKLLTHITKYDIDIKTDCFSSSLSYAAQNGHEDIFDKLLEHITDNKIEDSYEFTLNKAAENGHEAIFDKLLKHITDNEIEVEADYFNISLNNAAKNDHLIPIIKIVVFTNLQENNLLDPVKIISETVLGKIKNKIESFFENSDKLQKLLMSTKDETNKSHEEGKEFIDMETHIRNLDDLINIEIGARRKKENTSEEKEPNLPSTSTTHPEVYDNLGRHGAPRGN